MTLIPGLRSNPSYFISITVSRKERNSRSQFPNRAVSELFNEKSRVYQLGSGNRVTLKISDWERKKVDNRIKREKERFLSETWQDPAKSADAGNRRNSNIQFFYRMQSLSRQCQPPPHCWGQHSTEVAFTLLIPQPQVWFLTSQEFFWRITHSWCCWDELTEWGKACIRWSNPL